MRREKLVLPTMMMTTLMTKTVPNTATHLASTLNQEHTITAVLGLTNMANAMATQEQEILGEEDNDGAMNYQVNETEGVDNIEELQQHLLKMQTTRSECYKKKTIKTQAPTVKPPPIVPSNITRPPIVPPPPIAPRNRNKTVTKWRVEITVTI
jgi:hypothetical protein